MAERAASNVGLAEAMPQAPADDAYASIGSVTCHGTSLAHASTHADYDLLPYPSMPIAHTQPAHLAATATLFGLAPVAVDRARILELGCAAGGNIIPLAERFPGASFLGIDLSQRHIADGLGRITALGIDNVRLQQADLATLDLGEARFDYIICHGVFSWVPKPAQDAIFRLCQQLQSPNGIATISYNVLPGWHLRTAIRDLCLRHAGTNGSPMQRVARARTALDRIAAASDRAEPYGLLLQTEARRLKGVPSAYILGEFLAPDNAPCYVRDFIEQATANNLQYLCEADLFAAVPPSLDAASRDRVTAFTGTDRAESEQDIDFLTGRLFRRSILVRSRPAGASQPRPEPSRLWGMHVGCSLRLDATRGVGGPSIFVDDLGRPITIRDPAISQAILRLTDAFPGTLTLEDLIRGGDTAPSVEVVERIRNVVYTIVMAGRASISVVPLRVGSAEQTRPAAWRVARLEAAAEQAWITSLRHTGLPALPVFRFLLPMLDGTRDLTALRVALADALYSEAVPMPAVPAGQDLASSASLDAIAGQYLEQALLYLARQGVLEPDDAS